MAEKPYTPGCLFRHFRRFSPNSFDLSFKRPHRTDQFCAAGPTRSNFFLISTAETAQPTNFDSIHEFPGVGSSCGGGWAVRARIFRSSPQRCLTHESSPTRHPWPQIDRLRSVFGPGMPTPMPPQIAPLWGTLEPGRPATLSGFRAARFSGRLDLAPDKILRTRKVPRKLRSYQID
jgi:hypothetical protein